MSQVTQILQNFWLTCMYLCYCLYALREINVSNLIFFFFSRHSGIATTNCNTVLCKTEKVPSRIQYQDLRTESVSKKWKLLSYLNSYGAHNQCVPHIFFFSFFLFITTSGLGGKNVWITLFWLFYRKVFLKKKKIFFFFFFFFQINLIWRVFWKVQYLRY